jgi:4-diphosphocytidyl-2-C-methyl-D-erythritol kinase
MTRAGRVEAQAKINVWLHVGGTDAFGYHELFTLFQRVDLADTVLVRALDRDVARLDWTGAGAGSASLGPADQNLAYRAARAFQTRTGWPAGFEIELTKRIPVGGGLGGGSADAGAVLRVLNALAPEPLPPTDLLDVAAQVGSDTPFLASDLVRAVGLGRGEKLETFRVQLPPTPLALAVPPFGVATADAYRWLDALGPRSLDVAKQARTVDVRSSDRITPWDLVDLGNDFEQVVEQRYPELERIRLAMGKGGARMARLSGSGSTVFGVFPAGVPSLSGLGDGVAIHSTHTSASVVQVEVLE